MPCDVRHARLQRVSLYEWKRSRNFKKGQNKFLIKITVHKVFIIGKTIGKRTLRQRIITFVL
jgi:hypothetical protein